MLNCHTVRRVVAKMLLFLFAFSALVPMYVKTEIGRWPELVHHYFEHQHENPSLSYFEFLTMHYGEQFAHHQSEHEHDNLPFKGNENHQHTACVFFAILQPDLAFPLPACDLPDFERQPFFAANTYFLAATFDIWQPPKA